MKIITDPASTGGSGASTATAFVTIGNDAALSAERALTGTANQVVVTDNGVNSTVVLSTPQSIGTGSSVTFGGITDSALTSGRVVLAGASGVLRDDANLTWDGQNLATVGTVDYQPQWVVNHVGSTAGSAGYVNFRRARAATTAVLNGDAMGSFVWQGYQNGSYQNSASVGVNVIGVPAGTVVPSYMQIAVTGAAALDSVVCILAAAGIGMGANYSPSASLHLKAGTATASTAPLKFTTGTALATPEDGAVEYHSSHLYATISATRYQLDQQVAVLVGPQNLVSTVEVIAANTYVHVGRQLEITSTGSIEIPATSTLEVSP